MRVGYVVGQPETLDVMRRVLSQGSLSNVSTAAALAAFGDREDYARQRTLNRETKAFTRKAFEDAGFPVLPVGSQLRHGRRPARRQQLRVRLPRRGHLGRAPLPAAPHSRAHHHRHGRRNAARRPRDAQRPADPLVRRGRQRGRRVGGRLLSSRQSHLVHSTVHPWTIRIVSPNLLVDTPRSLRPESPEFLIPWENQWPGADPRL